MITLTSTDQTPDLLSLQTHFPLIDYPEGRADILGDGVTVAMIGCGWDTNHEALFHNPNIRVPSVPPWATEAPDHDNAVLGILCGWYTGTGIRGLCPNATVRPLYFGMLADTLASARCLLKPGDIILLERTGGTPSAEVPVEVSPGIFDAVKTCVDAGLTVIIPAGNTDLNLDTLALPDTGAIYVAAAYCQDGYVGPAGFTAYGSRIDLCAPMDTLSAGYGYYIASTNKNRWYAKVQGCSYSGAMVAGVCAGIQSARIAAGKPVLGGLEMRDLLRSTGTETDKTRLPNIQIGRMISMRKALAATLPAKADFDGDGKVGLKDFFAFALAFGGTDERFDLDGDGRVGMSDFWLFKDAFGKGDGNA